MQIIVVVDANILVASNNLGKNPWKSLAEQQEEWGFRIAVPEVALVEAVHRLRANWGEELEKVGAMQVGALDLSEFVEELAALITAKIETLETRLRVGIEEMGASLVSPPQIDYMDIVRRAVHQLAPYNAKEPDGFRDTVIWHTVLSIAAENPEAEVWFVSENNGDFGPKDGNWVRAGGGRKDDCPLVFDPQLEQELADLNLTGRVHYVTNLRRLQRHFASRFEPINEAEREKLVDDLDYEELGKQLSSAADGFVLDPRAAALDLQASAGRVISTQPLGDTWRFDELARTNESGWTAQFVVSTEVDFETIDQHGGSTGNKTLRLAGDVTIGADGNICEVVVTTANALHEDPMRAQWKRRDAVRARSAGLFGVTSPLQATLNKINADFAASSGLQATLNKINADFAASSGLQATLNKINADFAATSSWAAMNNSAANILAGAAMKTPAKKTPAKKTAEQKPAAKKTAEQKPAAKKPAAKKPAAKKPAAKKTAEKKTAEKKTAEKKTAPKKTPAKKTRGEGRGEAAR
ncbi:PIN domain-containing protein [Nocardia mangyaensis]|uniref:PIN domain-containing protein n=1 Tax=Nocardia mangyaensis TaxID=2213200 RepID=UPI0026767960|nr:PIN domain-containing protein [Nocardia mangyaensis]MDO3651170.1 PIN domain-containing protein [Nocardia mangyaensis]